jgi:hypothetical protein
MTMHPDPHPPHPVRPFADPPAYRRYPVAEPPARTPAWRRALAVSGIAIVEGFTLVFGLASVLLASLMLFGDPASINAWGLWFRGIFGGW